MKTRNPEKCVKENNQVKPQWIVEDGRCHEGSTIPLAQKEIFLKSIPYVQQDSDSVARGYQANRYRANCHDRQNQLGEPEREEHYAFSLSVMRFV